MYQQLKSPVNVQVELTTRCNHKCLHCYNHWRCVAQEDVTLTLDDVRKIIDNLRDSEVPNLLITGGEPMLYPDTLIKSLEFGIAAGLKCSVNSNLTLMTSEIAKNLKRLKVGILTSMLSFDSVLHDYVTTSEGSFDRLIGGIKLAQEYGIPISVNMVVMQLNADQIYKTGKFVHSLGISGFTATKVHPAQGSTNFEKLKLPPEKIAGIFDTLIRLNEEFGLKVDSLTTYPTCLLKDMNRYGRFIWKRSCSAGKTGCTIGPDGQVRPCGRSDMTYGNAINESLLQIWPRLKEWRDGSLLPGECKECKYVLKCSGGCRMDCKHYGKIDSMDQYASGKDFTCVPQEPEEVKPLNPEAMLVINPNLRCRDETFGTAMIVEGSLKSVVTHDSAWLLNELKGKVFCVNNVVAEYGLELSRVQLFFYHLHKQAVISLA